jgi:hypothetical protein
MRFSYKIIYFSCLIRFSYEIVFLLHIFLVRCPYLISRFFFLAAMIFHDFWVLFDFLMSFHAF